MPLRATEHEEAIGMDVVQHGEEAYVTGEGAILVTHRGLHGARARTRSAAGLTSVIRATVWPA